MLSVAETGASAASRTSCPANGRHATAPTRHPYVVTCRGLAAPSAGFCATTPAAYATAASRHSTTPSTEAPPSPDIDSPTVTAPANDTAIPASSLGGVASPSSRAPSRAMRIGPMFTTRAAVPASTCCSPQLRATM
ncbi:hypothetical protein SGRIM128S_00174 [Streptomyces griseomycini]